MAKIKWQTEEEALEKYREEKRALLSFDCNNEIKSFEFGEYLYSYEVENQMNFEGTMKLFADNMIQTINWNAYQNGGKIRLELNKESFTQVYLTGVKHKVDCLSKLNDGLYPLIRNAKTKEEINEISWHTPVEIVETEISRSKTLENKVASVEIGMDAQQVRNAQMEMIILDVADIALSGGF